MRKIGIFLLFLSIGFLTGCSGLKEATKGFLGVSTKELENGRKDSLKKDFSGSFEYVHKKIKDALRANNAYIYKDAKSLDFIALYISEKDTTPAGIFLTKIEENKIRVEVSSPSTYAKELIYKIVLNALQEPKVVKAEKGNIDAGK